jgi:flagellar M-ring protein FliF
MPEQIQRLLNSLTLRQKFTIGVAAVVMLGGLLSFLRWSKEQSFQVLYSGLAAEDAAAVVAKLKESGVEYRLAADGSSVRVAGAAIPDLRLQMASAGLPKSGRIGFEIFDKTNFGVTEFAEQINYQRAIEGELERSVMSISEVERARVHVTPPKESIFLESRRPGKASVLVRLRPGARLSPQNVQAIQHLASSAVDGLSPDHVAVLDIQGNLLSRPQRGDSTEADPSGEQSLEYRRMVERDLLLKINETLEPLLGPERFRAGVTVDCDFTSGEQSEEIYDPERSVMLSSQRTEDQAGAATATGVPGTASNLPRPTSRPGAGGQGVARRTENITYQSSRTVRRLRLPRGTVKRLSISVLVDHSVRVEGSGAETKRVVEPPSPERLKVTRDLVAAAVGLVPERGDQLIVESLPFESTLAWAPPDLDTPAPVTAGPDLPVWLRDLLSGKNVTAAAIGGAAVLLVLGAVTFLAVRKRKRTPGSVSADSTPALPGGRTAAALAAGEEFENRLSDRIEQQKALKAQQEKDVLNSLKLPSVNTKKAEVLARELSEQAKRDPEMLAQLVSTWIGDQDS